MTELLVLTSDDWMIWRALRLQALAEAPYAFSSVLADWQGEGDREGRWRDRLSIPGSHNVVAFVDGDPVGMASGVPTDLDGEVEVISMWVAPQARGREIGDALLQAVAQWARYGGARRLRLAVGDGNAAATSLYLRNGFSLTGELGDLMPDGVRRELIMATELSLQQ